MPLDDAEGQSDEAGEDAELIDLIAKPIRATGPWVEDEADETEEESPIGQPLNPLLKAGETGGRSARFAEAWNPPQYGGLEPIVHGFLHPAAHQKGEEKNERNAGKENQEWAGSIDLECGDESDRPAKKINSVRDVAGVAHWP